MKAELVPVNGDPPIPITRDLTVIGRREYCDARIDFHGVSKRHCLMVKTDGLLVIRDLATTNGTKVNGQRVRWAALLPNDRLTIGGYKMRVYLGADDAPSPSQEPALSKKSTSAPPGPSRRPHPKKKKAVEPSVGFAAPTPVVAPLVRAVDRKDPDWIMPEVLLDEDDETERRPSPIQGGDDEVFVIDLD
jgi:predicted component of type VI protein secretion system